ncbi:MAG: NfeD family protein [Treponema sp.]|nr:NfeD family protein [Treponema sp.]MBR4385491.1 NfeD family protein [Treponema sp.]
MLLSILPMFWFSSWFWLAICVVCIVIEVSTLSLTTIWFAIGAFAMVFISMIAMPFQYQLLIFTAISVILMIFTRPIAVKKLAVKRSATNSDSIIGKKAIVTEKITPLEKGAIKVNGLIWTAKVQDESEFAAGDLCEIVSIEGATAVVKKADSVQTESTSKE